MKFIKLFYWNLKIYIIYLFYLYIKVWNLTHIDWNFDQSALNFAYNNLWTKSGHEWVRANNVHSAIHSSYFYHIVWKQFRLIFGNDALVCIVIANVITHTHTPFANNCPGHRQNLFPIFIENPFPHAILDRIAKCRRGRDDVKTSFNI